MLSKTIRNAAAGGKRDSYFEVEINEFDLETWAHEVRKLEAENAELRERKIRCAHCAREMFLADDGRKQMLLKDLEDVPDWMGYGTGDPPEVSR